MRRRPTTLLATLVALVVAVGVTTACGTLLETGVRYTSHGGRPSGDPTPGRDKLIAVSSAAGGSSLMIAVIVLASTIGLSVGLRRRDIALLRAIGATPRQVRRLVVREVAILWLLATPMGVLAGRWAAGWVRRGFVRHDLLPADVVLRESWIPPLVASAAALVVGWAAGWSASLRASRIPPTEALGEVTVESSGIGLVRGAVGLLGLCGGITLAVVASRSAGYTAVTVIVPTVFLLIIALAMFAPLVLPPVATLLGVPLRIAAEPGRLAVAGIAASARALTPVLTSLTLTFTLGASLWLLPTSLQHADSHSVPQKVADSTWTNQLIGAVLLGYAFIAAVNALVLYTLGRRREFAVLRLAGATSRQVRHVARVEQALLLTIAIGAAALICAATLLPALDALTGSPVPHIRAVDVGSALAVVAIFYSLPLLAVRRTLRTSPVKALAIRE